MLHTRMVCRVPRWDMRCARLHHGARARPTPTPPHVRCPIVDRLRTHTLQLQHPPMFAARYAFGRPEHTRVERRRMRCGWRCMMDPPIQSAMQLRTHVLYWPCNRYHVLYWPCHWIRQSRSLPAMPQRPCNQPCCESHATDHVDGHRDHQP